MTPDQLKLAQDLIVGVFVVLLMLSVGLDLSPRSLLETTKRPLALLSAVLTGYLLIPLTAMGLASVFELGEASRAGLILAALGPGGPMGAYLTLRARGDVPLAAALVLLFNVANIALIPIGLHLAGVEVATNGSSATWAMGRTLVMFQLLPLCVGMGIRAWMPLRAPLLQRRCTQAANALLGVFAVAMVGLQGGKFVEAGPRVIAAVFGTAAASAAWAYITSPREPRVRVALVAGGVIHSSSATLLLASTWFGDPETVLTVLVWSVATFTMGFGAAKVLALPAPQAAQ